MVELILTLVAGLIAALPQILTLIEARQTKRNEATNALVGEDIAALKRQLAVGGMPAPGAVLAGSSSRPNGPESGQH